MVNSDLIKYLFVQGKPTVRNIRQCKQIHQRDNYTILV